MFEFVNVSYMYSDEMIKYCYCNCLNANMNI